MKEPTLQTFEDVTEAPSSHTLTGDGYLVTPAVLARAGIHKYFATELGLTDRKPNEIISVYRSAETLQESVDSFESQTITLDHKWTSASNWKANAIGDVHDVEMRGEEMYGTLIIRDADAIATVRKGKTQLSNGYSARLVRKPANHRGQEYEYEQQDLRGNHIAVVTRGRCGHSCRIADCAALPNQKEMPMITRTVDGYTINLENEFSAQVVDRIVRLLDEAKQENTTLKAAAPMVRFGDCELDAGRVRSLVQQKDAEIAALKAALAHKPGSVTELEDEDDPYTAYRRRLVATSGAGDDLPNAHQVFAAKTMPSPQQVGDHWSARAKGLLDSGKLKIVTGDKDSRFAWMDSQSGSSILTRRRAV